MLHQSFLKAKNDLKYFSLLLRNELPKMLLKNYYAKCLCMLTNNVKLH